MEETENLPSPELTPLHPNHVKVTRIVAALFALPFVAVASIVEVAQWLGDERFLPPGVVLIPILLFALLLIFRVPLRRYHARGFDMGTDRLRVVRGIMFHSDSVVPFGRIQHIDVHQGPLQRFYDLATLTVHTAGTHNASVHLPGLLNSDAMAMREEIRAHIKRETM